MTEATLTNIGLELEADTPGTDVDEPGSQVELDEQAEALPVDRDEPDGYSAERTGDSVDDGSPETDAADLDPRALDAVPEEAEVVTAELLVNTLVEAVAPRRNRRRRPDDGQAEPAELQQPLADDNDAVMEQDTADQHSELLDSTVASLGVLDDSAWREHWPDNTVHIVARLLPRLSDAPALDGVQRTRMELALVEHHAGEFGTLGNLPIFVLPGAPGFTPIYNEIKRALRQKRRLDPVTVELRGILRRLPDRDTRYASARYSVLMGIEVHDVKRVENTAEQFAYWRGRAMVIDSRRYEHQGMDYQRVTAVVALKQRKPRLRGMSVTHVPVDFLVAPDHPHADRFRHIGQQLLIEGTIAGDVHRMSDNHPALEGLDPRRKAQLQVLRESIVTVAMGEFPNDAAEQDYAAWVKAGRLRPHREPRESRLTNAQRAAMDVSAVDGDGQGPIRGRSRPSLASNEGSAARDAGMHGRPAARGPQERRRRRGETADTPG